MTEVKSAWKVTTSQREALVDGKHERDEVIAQISKELLPGEEIVEIKRVQFEAKWASGPMFAEVAEAVGVPTDHILGMNPRNQGQEISVLFAPELSEDLNEDPDVYGVLLKRDADGILVKFGEPELQPGMWAKIREQMERGQ